MKLLKRNVFVAASFLLTAVIMSSAFARQDVFPFGDNQILIVDSWHQYYPVLQELHHKLTQGGSLFYTWRSGAGSNFWLMMAYYAMSPLYLFSIIFPGAYLREFFLLATVLKIALAAACFSVYIREHFRKNDLSLVFFGLMYACCGYLMGYYWNIMWLDAVALFPLIILGLEKLMHKKEPLLYVATLALALAGNFYIGYMICQFLFLYFLATYFSKNNPCSLTHFLHTSKRVALYSLLSIGLAAVVLLPAYRGLQLAYQPPSGWPDSLRIYSPFMDLFNQLLANVTPTIVLGAPNLYGGLLTVLLVILYFTLAQIPLRTKIINAALLGFMLITFNLNYLDYLWHGFRFPNGAPYRFSFVFVFLILSLAYHAYENLDKVTEKTLWHTLLIFGGYLLLAEKTAAATLEQSVFHISMLLLVLYLGTILLQRHWQFSRNVLLGLLCLMVVGEMTLAAWNGTAAAGTTKRDGYPFLKEEVVQVLAELESMDRDFYRIAMTSWYGTNDPLMYGYRGISQFSSTANAQVTRFAKQLGLSASPAGNKYLYASSTPVVNGLFSIKYLLARYEAERISGISSDLLLQRGYITVYEHKYHLPLGIMVHPAIENWDTQSLNPFEVQALFLAHATGVDPDATGVETRVFTEIPVQEQHFLNLELGTADGIRQYYERDERNSPGFARLTYRIPQTSQTYAYHYPSQSSNTTIRAAGKEQDYETGSGLLMDLGVLEKGTELELSFAVEGEGGGFFDLILVSFDEEAYETVYAQLMQQPLQVKSFTDTRVEGTIEATRAGRLYTSIPFEPGWTARVNGKKAPIIPVADAMSSLSLPAGTHHIQFNYVPAGLVTGALISAVSLAALFALNWIPGRIPGRRQHQK